MIGEIFLTSLYYDENNNIKKKYLKYKKKYLNFKNK